MKTQEVLINKIGEIILYKIGTNAQENWDLIDESGEDDLWFHVNGLPSCHVVTSLPNPEKYNRNELAYIAKQGAVLCKQYSKYASQKKLPIIYSKIKDIKKTDVLGSVTTNQNAKLIYI